MPRFVLSGVDLAAGKMPETWADNAQLAEEQFLDLIARGEIALECEVEESSP